LTKVDKVEKLTKLTKVDSAEVNAKKAPMLEKNAKTDDLSHSNSSADNMLGSSDASLLLPTGLHAHSSKLHTDVFTKPGVMPCGEWW
jgi:hypothetical protein